MGEILKPVGRDFDEVLLLLTPYRQPRAWSDEGSEVIHDDIGSESIGSIRKLRSLRRKKLRLLVQET
jgi:hypothetical protein